MELIEVIKKRRSVRKFKKEAVPNHLLTAAIEQAKGCPSAGAIRGWEVYITKDLKFYDAPVYIVVCMKIEPYRRRYGSRGVNLYAVQDSAILCAYIQLMLVDLGLSSCWVGAFRETEVMSAIDAVIRPVAVLAVGYEDA